MTSGQETSNKMRITIAIKTISLFMGMLVLLAGACQQAAPAPAPKPAPAPLPTPAPTSTWKADGVISPGEYAKLKNFGDYELNWASDGQNVYIGVKAKTTGWVALGIQPGSRMKGADIIIGYVKDGKATVADHFSAGDFGPHKADAEFGGVDNILEFGAKEEGEYTTIEFRRALNTGDKFDHPLSQGLNDIIWSYGSDDQPTLKHVNRGYGEIDL
ncbi:MAG: hypothetical protein FJ008_04970 [Chloroflexi bacterium]|nr:hypothetical protein [Chloroflexota bacterium]MBM3172727.1 hypothetical protein [Chloroflexota bacterium]MBM3175569.1 hypothetical protein [Chloroflexota bacterium]MBM4451648.1 hypothetical protein [Chloroflexota bacterium]